MAGGGSSKSQDGKKAARIEIIPLIDVIFFLLATFVLYTLTLNKIRSIPVNLPIAADRPSGPVEEDTSVRLQVSDQGTYYWTQNKVTEIVNMNELEGRFASYKSSIAEPRVLIAGDDKGKFGPAIAALDQVRRAGILQVSIETRVSSTGK